MRISFKEENSRWIATDENCVMSSWDIYTWEIIENLPEGEVVLEVPKIVEINENGIVLVYINNKRERCVMNICASFLMMESCDVSRDSFGISVYPAEGRIDCVGEDEGLSREEILSLFFAEEAREELLKKFL